MRTGPVATRNIRFDIEYDGTAYHGWQIQSNAVSVSGTLEAALERVLQHPVRMTGSGRTDTGVHALGQVANFHTEREIPCENLARAVNSMVPRDLVVRRAVEVPEEFHARRSAVERAYRYQFYTAAQPSALFRNLCVHVRRPLDVPAMQVAARLLEGTHDFTAFRSEHCDAENPVRTIHALDVLPGPPFLFLDIRANAFLRNQVRIMAGTLLEVGLGRLRPEAIDAILRSRDRRRASPTLPPRGLILMRVRYPNEPPIDRWPSTLCAPGE